jgi:hypothetical protein
VPTGEVDPRDRTTTPPPLPTTFEHARPDPQDAWMLATRRDGHAGGGGGDGKSFQWDGTQPLQVSLPSGESIRSLWIPVAVPQLITVHAGASGGNGPPLFSLQGASEVCPVPDGNNNLTLVASAAFASSVQIYATSKIWQPSKVESTSQALATTPLTAIAEISGPVTVQGSGGAPVPISASTPLPISGSIGITGTVTTKSDGTNVPVAVQGTVPISAATALPVSGTVGVSTLPAITGSVTNQAVSDYPNGSTPWEISVLGSLSSGTLALLTFAAAYSGKTIYLASLTIRGLESQRIVWALTVSGGTTLPQGIGNADCTFKPAYSLLGVASSGTVLSLSTLDTVLGAGNVTVVAQGYLL